MSLATSGESGEMRRARSSGSSAAGELALVQVKHREIQQQAVIFRGEAESLAVMVNGGGRIAFADQKLRGGVMRGGDFFDGERRVGTGVCLQLRDIAEINGVVVDDQAGDVFIAADGIHMRRGNGRFGGGAGAGSVAEAVAINARDDGLRDGHLAGGGFVTDAVAVFGDAGGDNAAAILEHDGIGGRRRHDQ